MIRMLFRSALMIIGLALPAHAEIAIQTVTSPSGIKAWLVEDHGIPFTSLQIRFQGGTSLDRPGKRGAVNLMTALLEEGADGMDSQQFAAARDDLAAKIGFDSDQDGVSVSASFLTENRNQGLALLHSALTNPRFDPDAVERVRGQVLSNLQATEKDPSEIASKLARARTYGNHPYATDGSGTVQSVTGLSRDDLMAAFKDSIARDRIYVAAAGDISPADLGKLLDTLFAGLPDKGAPQPGPAMLSFTNAVTVEKFPGPQSVVIFGQQGMRFDNPDYFAASLLNDILGGGRFTARLMTEVRDKRGLTYGIGTSLASYDHAEALFGQFQASNDKVAEAIKVIREEWVKIARDGVTQVELDTAKTYMTGAYPLRFDGNNTIASILVGMQIMGLSPDYPKTRNAKVEAVTLADMKRVAAKLFTPDTLGFIVVGDPTGVESQE